MAVHLAADDLGAVCLLAGCNSWFRFLGGDLRQGCGSGRLTRGSGRGKQLADVAAELLWFPPPRLLLLLPLLPALLLLHWCCCFHVLLLRLPLPGAISTLVSLLLLLHVCGSMLWLLLLLRWVRPRAPSDAAAAAAAAATVVAATPLHLLRWLIARRGPGAEGD